jgi:hypothetical protein
MKEYEIALLLSSSSSLKQLKCNNFDAQILREWSRAMQMGYFKFSIDQTLPTRQLAGKFSLLVQLNPKRLAEKRTSEIKSSERVHQDFDVNRFNFTRIDDREILFRLASDTIERVDLSEPTTKQVAPMDTHYVIINNSPIELGHVLLVPRLKSSLNQVLIQETIELAVKFRLSTTANQLIIGFNSLCL